MAKQRRLNRQAVIEQAATLADGARDPNAVTLTALAAVLGIKPPSLYNHVASLEDLRRGLTLHGLQALTTAVRTATLGRTGRDGLTAVARCVRDFAEAHPGLYPLTVAAPDPADVELTALSNDLVQTLLLLLASYGVQGDDALHALRGFRALVHGFCALEQADGYKLPLDPDVSFNRMVAIYLDGLIPAGAQVK